MKVAAVICELNPLHNGHQLIFEMARRGAEAALDEARGGAGSTAPGRRAGADAVSGATLDEARGGADYVVALMSGDYVQRGTPAVVGRRTRAEMALACGADLVLAYPTRFATSSAESFAAHAVEILNGIGCVDTLVFGSESGDLSRLDACAAALAFENSSYLAALRDGLSRGLSFPVAREAALSEFADLLREPNNILAIEYLKALRRTGSQMKPVTIRRRGGGYHSTDGFGAYPSATALRGVLAQDDSSIRGLPPQKDAEIRGLLPQDEAIRELLTPFDAEKCESVTENASASEDAVACAGAAHTESGGPAQLAHGIPAEGLKLLMEEIDRFGTTDENDLSLLLADRLWAAESAAELTSYLDVTDDLAKTIFRERSRFCSFSAMADRCYSKSLTRSHVSRALLHIALDMKKDEAMDGARYAHILGFRKEAEALVGEIMRKSVIPVIVNPPKDMEKLAAAESEAEHRVFHENLSAAARDVFHENSSTAARRLFDEELRVSNLYRSIRAIRSGAPCGSALLDPVLVR